MSLPLRLYRFLVGTGRDRLVGRKEIIGEVTALCWADAVSNAEANFAETDKHVEVLDVCIDRQEPNGRWVRSEDCPETIADAWFYVTGEEADGVPYA